MKTPVIAIFLLLTGISMFLLSCKKDNDEPENVEFAFSLKTGPGYISDNSTLISGEQFRTGIDAIAATGNSLSRFIVIRTLNTKSDTAFDTTFSVAVFKYDFHGISLAEPGEEEWNFTIFQNDDRSINHGFIITTENTVGPIFTYDTRILGAQINGTGSSFATTSGVVYPLDQAKINALAVDMLYYFSLTESVVLSSPDSDEAAHIFTDGGTYEQPGPNALITWPIRNSTRFRVILDPIDWDAIQDDSQLITYSQGATEVLAANLKIGNYVSFVTNSGKKGLIRINGIYGEEDGTIDISVKVQQ